MLEADYRRLHEDIKVMFDTMYLPAMKEHIDLRLREIADEFKGEMWKEFCAARYEQTVNNLNKALASLIGEK